MNKKRMMVWIGVLVITTLLAGCGGFNNVRNVGESRPADLSRTSMCAINQEFVGKELYTTGAVVALSGGEFLLECQEMKGHRIWVETSATSIPSPDTVGQIVGVYGVVAIPQGSDKPRLVAKGIEYLGKVESAEEEQSSHSGHGEQRKSSGGSCH